MSALLRLRSSRRLTLGGLGLGLVVASALVADVAYAADVPSNGWVVWASDRQDGRHEIYLMKADGTGVTRLTTKGGTFPGWSPDGKWIAYRYTPDGSTHVMRHTGKGDKKIFDGEFEFWMWDGTGLICRKGDDHYRVNPDTGASKLLFRKSDFSKIGKKALNPGGITRDGRYLLAHSDIYRPGYTGSNGTFKAWHAAVILDFQDKNKIYFFGSGCEPNTAPSGAFVYHVCGGGACDKTHPDPYRMNIADLATRKSYAPEIAHADADWGHEYFPRISNDNVWMAYGATTGCHDHDTCDYEIYLHRLGAGNSNRTRITTNAANDQWPHLFVGTLPSVGCSGAADCDDKDACTLDKCVSGSCSNTPISGCCKVDGECGDGDACTADSCVSHVCQHKAISGCCTKDSQCADSSTCTKDVCTGHVCKHTAISGCCSKDGDCDDANICTTDACNTKTGVCANAKIASCCSVDTDCDDGDACTNDTCTAKVCGHQAKTGCCTQDSQCDDGDSCTDDSCNLTTNACENQPNASCKLSLPAKINCGSNAHDVVGWIRDDAFVTGGEDWENPDVVDTAGVVGAAPAEVYRSVRHKSPHAYVFPVPNGTYRLTFHFTDAYQSRAMTYEVEGKIVIKDLDIVSKAGGVNKAYVETVEVVVSDGDGMEIKATSTGDVFEAGLEIAAVVPPTPDGGIVSDAAMPADGGAEDARLVDAAPAADAAKVTTMSGGCSLSQGRGGRDIFPGDVFIGLALLGLALFEARLRGRRG